MLFLGTSMSCIISDAHTGPVTEPLSSPLASTQGHEYILRPHGSQRKVGLWAEVSPAMLREQDSMCTALQKWSMTCFSVSHPPTPSMTPFDLVVLCATAEGCSGPTDASSICDMVPWALAPRSRTKSSQDDKPFQPDQGLRPPLSNILLLFAGYEV